MKRSTFLLLAAFALAPVVALAPSARACDAGYWCNYGLDEPHTAHCQWDSYTDPDYEGGLLFTTCYVSAGCNNPGEIGPCQPRCHLGQMCIQGASTPIQRLPKVSIMLAGLLTPDQRAEFEAEVSESVAALPTVEQAAKVAELYEAKAIELHEAREKRRAALAGLRTRSLRFSTPGVLAEVWPLTTEDASLTTTKGNTLK